MRTRGSSEAPGPCRVAELGDCPRDGGGLGQPPCLAERDQATLGLIPQDKRHGAQAFANTDAANLPQLGEIPEDLRQSVERDSTGNVMDVVDADICREPPE